MKKAKTAKVKAAPRQVWVIVDENGRAAECCSALKKTAESYIEEEGERVVGPYVLAERRRNR